MRRTKLLPTEDQTKQFMEWWDRQAGLMIAPGPEVTVAKFVEWLTFTPAGADCLRDINDQPRQMSFDFRNAPPGE